MARFNTLSVGTLTVDKIVQRGGAVGQQAAATALQVSPMKAVLLVSQSMTLAVANAATQNVITIPAGMRVTHVYTTIGAAGSDAGTSHTLLVGDSGDEDGWDTDVNALEAQAGVETVGNGAYASAAATCGKLYSVATTLTVHHHITTVAAVSTGTYKLYVKGYLAA